MPPTRPTRAAGPTGRTRLNAAERRASILAAATEVFSELGYHRTRMSEVARRVGVSEPVVFQNFGSKAAVFAAVLDGAAERTRAELLAWADRAPDTGSWLAELLAPEHLASVHRRGTLGVLFADAQTLTGEDPAVLDAARRANRMVADTFADLLAAGRADGTVRTDLDPATGAWWLVSLLASQPLRLAVAGAPESAERGLAALTLHALTGR
ncbi:TetR/AcrR family transcriptional regulator [Kitasatospora sp. NPDC088391]|uniref:TetR/AcrR family transcriptional regulator n=1 Tax=Kitasatospora sp. NPDC088391 TaxID=3364074 RepID=UPI003804F3D1